MQMLADAKTAYQQLELRLSAHALFPLGGVHLAV